MTIWLIDSIDLVAGVESDGIVRELLQHAQRQSADLVYAYPFLRAEVASGLVRKRVTNIVRRMEQIGSVLRTYGVLSARALAPIEIEQASLFVANHHLNLVEALHLTTLEREIIGTAEFKSEVVFAVSSNDRLRSCMQARQVRAYCPRTEEAAIRDLLTMLSPPSRH